MNNDTARNEPGKDGAGVLRRLYAFLASAKLAMALLTIILACCVIGVTVYRGEQSRAMLFGTLWFNGLLILLVVNVGCCFFGRIWGRRLTLVSLGMVLFHLSFIAMFCGIVYNSLFSFKGLIRLTEGETLPNGRRESYDAARWGRLFAFSSLKGETTLVEVHRGYMVDGTDRKVAYEVAIGAGSVRKQGILYVTHGMENDGVEYYRDREGYSLLVILYDRQGRELYGAYVPLQGIKQKDDQYLFTTGTAVEPSAFPFPPEPERPVFDLQVIYQPSHLKGRERAGDAVFKVWPLSQQAGKTAEKPLAEGRAAVGGMFRAGEYSVSVREVRYWATMSVSYDPGKPIVLASFWVALSGVTLTTLARIFGRVRQR